MTTQTARGLEFKVQEESLRRQGFVFHQKELAKEDFIAVFSYIVEGYRGHKVHRQGRVMFFPVKG